MLVVGAGGLVQLWAWRRTAPRRALAATAAIVLLSLATLPWSTVYRAEDYRNLVLCAMLRQQPGQALAYLERWEALAPGRSDHLARAAALTQLGRHDETVDFLARLAAAEPDDPKWPATLAGAQERLGRSAAAAATRTQFHERFPGLEPTDLVAQRLAMYASEAGAHDPWRGLY